MTITGCLTVFNEEKRVENAIRNLLWCDEVIIVDKNSSDRTQDIVKQFNVRLFTMENSTTFNLKELDLHFGNMTSEWVFSFTASDMIHPECAAEIKRLISDPDFPYDVIHVPFRRYILGTASKNSPWYSTHAPMVYRKSVVRINHSGVHDAIQWDTDRHYKMKDSDEYCMYHLSHSTVDHMMDRHLRYWRGEANTVGDEKMSKSFIAALKSIFRVFVVRRSFMLGWKGVAMGFAYITYFMMAFVYKWEAKYSDAPAVYDNLKKKILSDWEKDAAKKG